MDKAQPREVWEREVLGDVTINGRVQDLPSRERLGTRLSYAAVRVTDGTSLRNGMWYGL